MIRQDEKAVALLLDAARLAMRGAAVVASGGGHRHLTVGGPAGDRPARDGCPGDRRA